MNYWMMLTAPVWGAALALFYFGGLWWTVKRLPQSRNPGLLMFSGLIVRLGTIMAGFYLVTTQSPPALLTCLAGFFITRAVYVRRMKKNRITSEEMA